MRAASAHGACVLQIRISNSTLDTRLQRSEYRAHWILGEDSIADTKSKVWREVLDLETIPGCASRRGLWNSSVCVGCVGWSSPPSNNKKVLMIVRSFSASVITTDPSWRVTSDSEVSLG